MNNPLLTFRLELGIQKLFLINRQSFEIGRSRCILNYLDRIILGIS